jgi:exonuclease 3'-5' domain-containing protein 1
LKDILQDDEISQFFFDVRNDSDAPFAHFGVALQGVEDVQLMESASRKTSTSRKSLNGLAKCVDQSTKVVFHTQSLAGWKLAKRKGEKLFKTKNGVFNDDYGDYYWEDDGATSCRDIISSANYDMYYSD